jgi:hypothetical protein
MNFQPLQIRFNILTLGFALLAVVVGQGCDTQKQPNNKSATTATDKPPILALNPTRERPKYYMNVSSPKGGAETINADGDSDIIYMATWCPYSKQLKSFLTDPRVKEYTAKRKLQFVFEESEWPTIKKHLERDAAGMGISKAETPSILRSMKLKARNAQVMEPSFLRGLPGAHYFAKGEMGVNSFPTVASGGNTMNRMDWISSVLDIPDDLVEKVMDKYDPDK